MMQESFEAVLTGLRGQLEDLDARKAQVERAILAVEGLTVQTGDGRAKVRAKPVQAAKAPPPSVKRTVRKVAKEAGNGKRGSVRDVICSVLRKARRPMTPVALRDAMAKEPGFSGRNPKNLYTSVYVAARGDSRIKQTKEGFALK